MAETFSTFMPFTKDDPLAEAGLLGPVTLSCGVEAEVKPQTPNERKS